MLLSNDVAVCGDLNLWASLPEAFATAANQPSLSDLSAVWMHSIGQRHFLSAGIEALVLKKDSLVWQTASEVPFQGC